MGPYLDAYDYRTANKMLSALRQTLRQAWQLGQMETSAAAVVVMLVIFTQPNPVLTTRN